MVRSTLSNTLSRWSPSLWCEDISHVIVGSALPLLIGRFQNCILRIRSCEWSEDIGDAKLVMQEKRTEQCLFEAWKLPTAVSIQNFHICESALRNFAWIPITIVGL